MHSENACGRRDDGPRTTRADRAPQAPPVYTANNKFLPKKNAAGAESFTYVLVHFSISPVREQTWRQQGPPATGRRPFQGPRYARATPTGPHGPTSGLPAKHRGPLHRAPPTPPPWPEDTKEKDKRDDVCLPRISQRARLQTHSHERETRTPTAVSNDKNWN